MAQKKKDEGGPLKIEALKMREVALCVLGASPLIYNRQSEKAKRELLLPAVQKNRAAKRSELKHDPLLEYRNSVYSDPSRSGTAVADGRDKDRRDAERHGLASRFG